MFIVAAVAASKATSRDSSISSEAPAASFSAVWTALVLVVLSVVGTVIMRRVRSFFARFPSFNFTLLHAVSNGNVHWIPSRDSFHNDAANAYLVCNLCGALSNSGRNAICSRKPTSHGNICILSLSDLRGIRINACHFSR